MGSDREYLGVEPRAGADPDELRRRLEGTAFDGWTDEMNGAVAAANTDHEAGEAVEASLGTVADLVERALYVEYAAERDAHVGQFYERVDGDLEPVETVGGEGFSLRAITDYCKREHDFDGLR